MLYNWSGKPYHSPQVNLVAVEVEHTQPITITIPEFGSPHYSPRSIEDRPLWQCEGFDSQDDMDAWFLAVLKPGTTTEMHLCRFKTLP